MADGSPNSKVTNGVHHNNLNRNGTNLNWNDTFSTQLHDSGNLRTRMILKRTLKRSATVSNVNKRQ